MGDRSKLDPTHIWQTVFDAAAKALKVKITDTVFNMELDHTDGDSVTSHPPLLTVSALGVTDADTEIIPPQDVSSLKRIELYVDHNGHSPTGTVTLEISPVDSGDVWVTLSTVDISVDGPDVVKEVLARRVRVMKTVSITDECNIHIVGQG